MPGRTLDIPEKPWPTGNGGLKTSNPAIGKDSTKGPSKPTIP